MKKANSDKSARPIKGWRRYLTLRKFARNDEGATAVEFSIVALPFFLFSGMIFELTLNYFAQQTLHHGVAEVARLIKTNQVTVNTHNEAQFRTLLCARPVLAMLDCNKFIIDIREVGQFQDLGTPTLATGHVDSTGMGFNPGGPVTVNVLRVYYELPLVAAYAALGSTDNVAKGSRTLTSVQAFMIEPKS